MIHRLRTTPRVPPNTWPPQCPSPFSLSPARPPHGGGRVFLNTRGVTRSRCLCLFPVPRPRPPRARSGTPGRLMAAPTAPPACWLALSAFLLLLFVLSPDAEVGQCRFYGCKTYWKGSLHSHGREASGKIVITPTSRVSPPRRARSPCEYRQHVGSRPSLSLGWLLPKTVLLSHPDNSICKFLGIFLLRRLFSGCSVIENTGGCEVKREIVDDPGAQRQVRATVLGSRGPVRGLQRGRSPLVIRG